MCLSDTQTDLLLQSFKKHNKEIDTPWPALLVDLPYAQHYYLMVIADQAVESWY